MFCRTQELHVGMKTVIDVRKLMFQEVHNKAKLQLYFLYCQNADDYKELHTGELRNLYDEQPMSWKLKIYIKEHFPWLLKLYRKCVK